MDYGLDGGFNGMSILSKRNFTPHPEIGAFLSSEGLHWLAAHSQGSAEQPLVVQRGTINLPVHTSHKLDTRTPRKARLLEGSERGWSVDHGFVGTPQSGSDVIGPAVARGSLSSWGTASRSSQLGPSFSSLPPAYSPTEWNDTPEHDPSSSSDDEQPSSLV